LVVHIHSGKDLKAADLDGKSDCYVTLSYSKNAKPLWSTRIIFHELNPCWDETAVLLLTADDVKASEQLRVQLWDSDRFTADDVLGRTGIDVLQLVKQPGKLFQREDCLLGVRKGSNTMPGKVKWDVVFYGNRALNKALMTDGKDERLPVDLDVGATSPYLETKLTCSSTCTTPQYRSASGRCLRPKPMFYEYLPIPNILLASYPSKSTTSSALNVTSLPVQKALAALVPYNPTERKRRKKATTSRPPTAPSYLTARRSTGPASNP